MTADSNNGPIVLVCAADDNYAVPLAVTVYSLLVNLKSNRRVALFIIDGGIGKLNKNKIVRTLNSKNVDLNWVQVDQVVLEKLITSRRFSTAIYYRLLIPQILPEQFDKAIYLDSDLAVEGDLEQLWNVRMGENYVLAVQDMGTPYVSSPFGLSNYKALGIPADYKYFNSGVLVLNLNKWRADNISAKVVEYIQQNRERIRWYDQDGLNAVLAGQWGELDPRWNQMVHIYSYSSWRDSPFTEDVYNEVIHHPYIIHFSDKLKPWHPGCSHPKRHLFFHYVNLTPWAGLRWTVLRKRLWNKLLKEKKRLAVLGKRYVVRQLKKT